MIYTKLSSIDSKTLKREVLSGFKGIDNASPIYSVDGSRATAMRNFISRDGSNHKRPGWRQIARFKDAEGNDQPINGFFEFTLAKQKYRIVYAGTTFYIYEEIEGKYIDILQLMESNGMPSNALDTSLLLNQPVQMFMDGDRVFFIGCGDYLVFEINEGKPELRRVQNDKGTYIPRTTTNIGPNEVEKDEDGSIIEYGQRQTDRDINVLSKWRINELIGSSQASEENWRTYSLDADNIDVTGLTIECYDYKPIYDEELEIDGYTKEDHLLTVGNLSSTWISSTGTKDSGPLIGDNLSGKTLSIDTSLESLALDSSFSGYTVTILKANTFNISFSATTNSAWMSFEIVANMLYNKSTGEYRLKKLGYAERRSVLSPFSITWTTEANEGIQIDWDGEIVSYVRQDNLIGLHIVELSEPVYELEENGIVYGYVDFTSGTIALTKPIRPIQGEANIKVKFAKTDNDASSKIKNCRFGCYFGVNGNTNTLFLSGNTTTPNFDYWSEAEDFTYFPSGNKCALGTQNTAVKGYLRLGDDSLAILKEESRHEPTLYIRSGVAPTVSESNVISVGYYYTRGKYITQGAISENCFGMLAGDPLFLSKGGVYGIVMTDSVAVEQRIARERSRFIKSLLDKHKDLSKATSIVYDNRYYLAIDGAVYVADARFTHTSRGDMSDTFNYEWWCWDNCPIRCWYEISGQLCFGTADGRLCVFDEEFSDRTYEKIGNISPDFTTNTIIYDTTVTSFSTDDLCYLKGNAYRIYIDNATVTDDGIKFPDSLVDKIHVGISLFADEVGDSGLEIGVKYIISSVDLGEGVFTLSDEEGNQITPILGGFRLLCSIDGEYVKASIDDNSLLQIRNLNTDELYIITRYNAEVWNVQLFKYMKSNVVAEWYTPLMDMGVNDYVKTLMRLTIATEQITNGRITFGWETKSASTLVDVDAHGLDVFDFGNLNFARFSFDTGFSSSYTRDVKADFNFILFRFISDNDCDCCIYSFTINYKVNRRNKGVF